MKMLIPQNAVKVKKLHLSSQANGLGVSWTYLHCVRLVHAPIQTASWTEELLPSRISVAADREGFMAKVHG